MSKLILLNIADSEISGFIQKLQELFSNKKSNSTPHITLRGPYKSKPSFNVLNRLKSFVNNIQTAQIDGVDMFENGAEYFVYFKVSINDLESVSWKKDFPKKEYGFNPHITICKSRDKRYAEQVFHFLNDLNIQIEVKRFELEFYQLGKKQTSLLSQNSVVFDHKLQSYLHRSKDFIKSLCV